MQGLEFRVLGFLGGDPLHRFAAMMALSAVQVIFWFPRQGQGKWIQDRGSRLQPNN